MELGFESIFQKESLSSTAIGAKSRDNKKLKNYYKLLETTNNNNNDQYDTERYETERKRNDFQSHRSTSENTNYEHDSATNKEMPTKNTKSSIDIFPVIVTNSKLLSQCMKIENQCREIQGQYNKLLEHCQNMESMFGLVLELLKKKKKI